MFSFANAMMVGGQVWLCGGGWWQLCFAGYDSCVEELVVNLP